jgi:carbonic anhydrase
VIGITRSVREGSKPEALFIACTEASSAPDSIAEGEFGDALLFTSLGAIVPPFEKGDSNMSGCIDYALSAGVRRIVILGHYDCGILKHLAGIPLTELPGALAGWLTPASGEVLFSTEAVEHVRMQVRHLLTYPVVTRQISSGQLEVAGWVYDPASGDITKLDPASHYNEE